MSALAPASVGLVGLGQMGRGIAANLDAAGMLGAVWDVNASVLAEARLSPLVSRHGLPALTECEVVVFVVPGSTEIAAFLEGPDGLLATSHEGQILIDLTTSHPVETRRLAAAAQKAGRAYVDAGMSGGAAGAESGELTLMVGGTPDAVARCTPVFDAIAARVFNVGPSGAGHTMKLVHNMICHTIFMATSEGCRAAERAGIPLERAVEVLNAGNACSYVSQVRFGEQIVPGRFDGRSRVANLEKDLAMAAELFLALKQPARYASLTAALLSAARAKGLADSDFTRLYPAYDELAAMLDEPAARRDGQ